MKHIQAYEAISTPYIKYPIYFKLEKKQPSQLNMKHKECRCHSHWNPRWCLHRKGSTVVAKRIQAEEKSEAPLLVTTLKKGPKTFTFLWPRMYARNYKPESFLHIKIMALAS